MLPYLPKEIFNKIMYHRMEKVVLDFGEELLAKQIERNYDALFDQLEHTVVAYSYTLPEIHVAGYMLSRKYEKEMEEMKGLGFGVSLTNRLDFGISALYIP